MQTLTRPTLARDAGSLRPNEQSGGLLCVANFPANTGYAWDFIEAVFGELGERLAERGVRTLVAYPSLRGPVRTLGRAAEAVELTVELRGRGLIRLLRFVRRHDIRVVYLIDRAAWDPAYVALRWAGVRRIVVHDHTSGRRSAPRGVKRMLKRLRVHVPGALADAVVAVSDFVAERKRAVDLVPAARVHRVWNSIPRPREEAGVRTRLREAVGLPAHRPIVGCACRATLEKGVEHLMRAFDAVAGATTGAERPILVYFGEGPAYPELVGLRERLASRDDIFFGGFRRDAADLLGGADVCVVPSVWEEAFGLAALESMARGVPVIASTVGGIPEVVLDGETGILVPPADERALAEAIREMLKDAAARRRLGAAGRLRARTYFSRDTQLARLAPLIEAGWP